MSCSAWVKVGASISLKRSSSEDSRTAPVKSAISWAVVGLPAPGSPSIMKSFADMPLAYNVLPKKRKHNLMRAAELLSRLLRSVGDNGKRQGRADLYSADRFGCVTVKLHSHAGFTFLRLDVPGQHISRQHRNDIGRQEAYGQQQAIGPQPWEAPIAFLLRSSDSAMHLGLMVSCAAAGMLGHNAAIEDEDVNDICDWLALAN